jgi:regulator of nucleoside diphosphate kinase
MNRSIVITESDMAKLQVLIDAAQSYGGRNREHLDELEEELGRAKVVKSKNIPKNTVTMNSRVRITDLDSSKEIVYQLVFPREADISKNKISVLAPIGTALLGYSVGDEIEWSVPGGSRHIRIDAVEYQPEAARVAV